MERSGSIPKARISGVGVEIGAAPGLGGLAGEDDVQPADRHHDGETDHGDKADQGMDEKENDREERHEGQIEEIDESLGAEPSARGLEVAQDLARISARIERFQAAEELGRGLHGIGIGKTARDAHAHRLGDPVDGDGKQRDRGDRHQGRHRARGQNAVIDLKHVEGRRENHQIRDDRQKHDHPHMGRALAGQELDDTRHRPGSLPKSIPSRGHGLQSFSRAPNGIMFNKACGRARHGRTDRLSRQLETDVSIRSETLVLCSKQIG